MWKDEIQRLIDNLNTVTEFSQISPPRNLEDNFIPSPRSDDNNNNEMDTKVAQIQQIKDLANVLYNQLQQI